MTKTTIGDHAVVLGGSMVGLLTARVLAEAATTRSPAGAAV